MLAKFTNGTRVMFCRPESLLPVAMFLMLSVSEGVAGVHQRPNIILILADDFGYECVGVNGATKLKTPHLDQMAGDGVRFEHCYAQPLCTPTRVQLMTGLYNVRNYVRFGFLEGTQRTFAHILKSAGYQTSIAGKWQLGHGFSGPSHFGFDDYCLWQLTRRPPRYTNPGLEINGSEVDFNDGEYGPDLVHQHVLDYIEQNQKNSFVVYYPMMLTHSPFQPTPQSENWDPSAHGETVNDDPTHFADMVAYMDRQIGSLLSHLDRLSLRENTLVLFLGDNGTGKGIQTDWNGRIISGGKGTATEAGMRVPLIASWKGKIPPGLVCRDLIDTTDFLPTICDAAAVDAPKELDGRSFYPQLLGQTGIPREWHYCWYEPRQGRESSRKPAVFARNHNYKLYSDGRLMRLGDDGYKETLTDSSNLSSEERSVREKLQAVIDRYGQIRPMDYVPPEQRR